MYTELAVTTNFSFLRGASHPEEFVERAVELGYHSIAVTDFNSLAGIVRAFGAARDKNFRFIVGCRLVINLDSLPREILPSCAPPQLKRGNISEPAGGAAAENHASTQAHLLVYPLNREAYGRLCRMLTEGNVRETGRQRPAATRLRTKHSTGLSRDPRLRRGKHRALQFEDFARYNRDWAVIIMPWLHRHRREEFLNFCRQVKNVLPAQKLLSLALIRNYTNRNAGIVQETLSTSEELNIPLLASNDVYYHDPERRMLQDVLTCIRHQCPIQKAGFNLFQNGERHLKPVEEMERLFKDHPQALERGIEISEACAGFSLEQLKYEYPDAICPANQTPLDYLSALVWEGARERYPAGVPEKVSGTIKDELKLIHELEYEKYFLTCYDIVKFARQRGILCQGRGAAANSAVCYCLGITAVDPDRIDLLFARFVSKERNEPPDIDIDFEHERREEVIQYIYEKYGRTHAGLTAEVITCRSRSALREVGKALGLSLEAVDRIASLVHGWTSHIISAADLKQIGINAGSHTIQNLFTLAEQLLRFPRHLSQHVGGFIICQKPLCETVPILNAAMPDRTMIEWDKDDIETLGMLKIDVLGLGMLTCIRKTLELVNEKRAGQNLPARELYNLPAEDPAVYDMLCEADTVGVFQVESRAQMSMLPRLKPRRFYDLVIEVAIVRPGPIHGKMIHPFLRRRNGDEETRYPDPRVEQILGKTLGVPLFQEQAMRLAIVLAGFTPGEAEKLRRTMAAWKKNNGAIATFKQRILDGLERNGYSEEFAETCVNQLKGFSEYGFPESHAASFALLVYASAWLKCHHPAEFLTALLNSQPMGFYPPAQIIQDAKNHRVEVLPIDINASAWDTTVTRDGRMRLGIRLIKGAAREKVEPICAAVKEHGPFNSIHELWLHEPLKQLSKPALVTLARANAFSSMRLTQREALWEIKALPAKILPFDKDFIREAPSPGGPQPAPAPLPPLSAQQSLFQDYEMTGFSLQGHPIALLRGLLNERRAFSAAALKANQKRFQGRMVLAAGLTIFRQRPGTSNGVIFLTLEDETGVMNLIVGPKVFDRCQKIVLASSCILARGRVEYVGKQVYLNVHDLESLDEELHKPNSTRFPSRSYSY